MYEWCPDYDLRFGSYISGALRREGIPICNWPNIYGDANHHGVVSYPEGGRSASYIGERTFDGFLVSHHTPQVLTPETPLGWDLERRINIHIRVLKLALEESMKRT